MLARVFQRRPEFSDYGDKITCLPNGDCYFAANGDFNELLQSNRIEDFTIADLELLIENGWWKELPSVPV